MTAAARDIGARIDRMPFSRWHVRSTAIVGSSRFFDAMDTTALAFVLPVLVNLWNLTPTQAGLLISASYVGQLVGASAGGLIAEWIGRIAGLRICLALMGAASVACAFAPSYAVLFALRVIQGLALGGEAPISATYMSEICPPHQRARAIVTIQLFYGFGIAFTSFMALFLIPQFGWRSLFVVGGLPVATALALRVLLPESPRWLAARGRSDDADATVTAIERKVYGTSPPPPIDDPEPAPSRPVDVRIRLSALVRPGLIRPTLSAWITAFCASLVSFALVGWMPTIYQKLYHLPVQDALRYSAISTATSLVGSVLAIVIIGRVGPKAGMTFGLSGVACCAAFLALAGAALHPIAVAAVVSVLFMLITLPTTGLFAYATELYPTHIRAFGVGVTSSWIRAAAIVVPPVIGMLLSLGGVAAIFTFLAFAAATGALSLAWLGVTTGITVKPPRPGVPDLATDAR